ncbi:uncharacterized protein LOC102807736 [Saccoglossus kowalevskii]|uniref:Uncharacterized protein LOC102807736 n=1 Tax=Saccoglossus kowalevskii TaxID=10224 RepID=A0ABM0MHN0_SACKO|nr:PREDICTED: uncharacterized protein LOC102807736 [Saccoglossus kowalevskii]
MWEHFLAAWNEAHFFLHSTVTLASDIDIFTDALSTVGFGGYFKGSWFCDKWPVELDSQHNDDLCMALLELYLIVVAAMLWGTQWSQHRISFNCDNFATVHIIRKGRASSHCCIINKLLRWLTLLAMQHNFVFLAHHLPGAHNGIADSLSRFQFQRFRLLAPAAQQHKTQCPLFYR